MLKAKDVLAACNEINNQTPPGEQDTGGETKDSAEPCILDAVADQLGGHWIRFGTTARPYWFSLAELQMNERKVFTDLSGPGMTFLTPSRKNAFKRLIENHATYRPALVAEHPGWVGGSHYVFGNGDVVAPPGDTREVIVAFEPDPKFTPKGTLQEWQQAVGPVVSHQTYLLFLLAYAFVGPLLRFAPPYLLNPQIELVGRRETGKTTAAATAASVWAGDPESDAGGGETWDLTVSALDGLKRAHADNFLLTDETNLAGTSSADQGEVVGKAVFKMASTGGRKRFTDTKPVPNLRLALLSTSNVPLRRLAKAKGAVQGALTSRMLTIRVHKDRPHGVLDRVPDGFSNAREAVQHQRTVINLHYGAAGRAFIERLVVEVAADEEAVRRTILKRMERCSKELEIVTSGRSSARVENTLDITFAAFRLARDWRIVPKDWGPLLPMIVEVYCSLQKQSAASPIDRIVKYVEAHREELVKADSMTKPYSTAKFEKTAGFIRQRDGGRQLLVPARRFQREFVNYRILMRALKKADLTKTEGASTRSSP